MENFTKLITLKELIINRFLFLESIEGYKLTSVIFENLENSELDKYSDLPQISVFYSNSRLNRKVQLDLTITNIPTLFIRNTNTGDYFMDNDYFQFKYKKKLVFKTLEGQNSIEKMENYFKLIIKELKGALHNVINGNEWLKVPEDWGPYK